MIAAMLLVASAVASPSQMGQCRQMIRARSAGETVEATDTTSVACSLHSGGQPSLSYDASSKTARATHDLAAGDYIGRAWIPPLPAIRAGERVTLFARVRHIAVSRAGIALQSAAPGERLFIRLDDGTIISSPSANEAAAQ